MRHPICTTKNNVQIYAHLTGSRVGRRLSRQPQLLTLAKEILTSAVLRDSKIYKEYDMGRQIGYEFVVGTTDKDPVFYARLPKEDIYTRFVKNSAPVPTNFLTILLIRDHDQNYELSDVWIGRLSPPRPGSTDEIPESKAYWSDHAVILNDQQIQTQTLTKTCPY